MTCPRWNLLRRQCVVWRFRLGAMTDMPRPQSLTRPGHAHLRRMLDDGAAFMPIGAKFGATGSKSRTLPIGSRWWTRTGHAGDDPGGGQPSSTSGSCARASSRAATTADSYAPPQGHRTRVPTSGHPPTAAKNLSSGRTPRRERGDVGVAAVGAPRAAGGEPVPRHEERAPIPQLPHPGEPVVVAVEGLDSDDGGHLGHDPPEQVRAHLGLGVRRAVEHQRDGRRDLCDPVEEAQHLGLAQREPVGQDHLDRGRFEVAGAGTPSTGPAPA